MSMNFTLISKEEKVEDNLIKAYEIETQLEGNELEQYYIDNGIMPMNAPEGTGESLYYEEVPTHLNTRFPEYSNWESVSSKYVGDIYSCNPIEIDENAEYIKEAKRNAEIEYNYIGCGPLALYCQLDYIARSAGYSSIANNLEEIDNLELSSAPNATKLAEEIFRNTETYPADSIWGEIFNISPDAGTFTFPSDFIDSAREILARRGLNEYTLVENIDEETNEITYDEEYFEENQEIYVHGDSIVNLESHQVKINNIIDSIDKGMPVIWWTTDGAEEFSNHYMNIFGYEYWNGIDENQNEKTHLMFLVRMNWGIMDVYMDSDILNALNSGFIFFEERDNRALIKESDYQFSDEYSNQETTNYIFINDGKGTEGLGYFTVRRLRVGYITYDNSENSKKIIMSAKNINAGTAYLQYDFNNYVRSIAFNVGWFSDEEGIYNSNDGTALVQYLNSDNNWITALDLMSINNFSVDKDNLTSVYVKFNEHIKKFRIIVNANNSTNTDNLGRLVLGTMNVFFRDHEHFIDIEGYSIIDEYEHQITCNCGETLDEYHSFDDHYIMYNESQHKACCICASFELENHNYGHSYESISSSQHHSYCICGSYNVESHVFRVSQVIGGLRSCIGCGYQKFGGGLLTLSNEYKVYESLNGSYILNDGTIYLVDEDINSYFEGTLEFYLINNNELM